jgi:hypothetical protein
MRSGVTCTGAAVAIGISSLPESREFRCWGVGELGDGEEFSSFSSEFGVKVAGMRVATWSTLAYGRLRWVQGLILCFEPETQILRLRD